jgi:hypothetical protein
MSNIDVKNIKNKVSDVKSDVVSDVIKTSRDASSILEHKVQIPQGIKLNNLHNPYKKNVKKGRDVNAHLLSLFVLKNQWKRKPINNYITLNSSVLRQVCGGQGGGYTKYLNALIDQDIIEQYSNPYSHTYKDGTTIHSKGTYSTKFGLSKQYRLKCEPTAPLQEYNITDKNIIAKINLARIEKLQRILKTNPTAVRVYEGLKGLTIDTERAIQDIKDLYKYKEQYEWSKAFLKRFTSKELRALLKDVLRNKKNKHKLATVLKQYRIKATDIMPNSDATYSDVIVNVVTNYTKMKTRIHWIKVLDAIQKGNHSYISMSEDKRTKRLFHTMTMTPKNIRPYIKLHDKNLIEFDASNCQWHLLIKLCNILCNSFYYKDLISKYGIITKEEQQEQQQTDITPLYMLHNFFDKYKIDVQKDCAKLEAYLQRDLLRPMIVKAYKEEKGKDISIQEAKGYLIKNVLFGNPSNYNYSQWTSVKAFKDAFPFIYEVLVKLKKYWIDESFFGYTPYGKNKESNRFKGLPLILQKMESEIFQQGLSNLNAPFVTIHDAVITNEDGKAEVLKALNNISESTKSNLTFKYKEIS